MKIFIVYGVAYEETDIRKAFLLKSAAEMYADLLNNSTDDYYWYTTEKIELEV